MENADFGLWLPRDGADPVDLDNQASLHQAILEAAKTSDAEVARLVTHLAAIGHFYQAARCLEIVAQHKLGLDFTGAELVSYQAAGFGHFHHVIHDLLQAGALYHRARRRKTAEAAFRRALLFVEEAIRSVSALDPVDNGELACLGIAFELAGHCCAALEDSIGLEYYEVAQQYWGRSARMRPEALLGWAHHPVTQTVIRCLDPVVELYPDRRDDDLFASDYLTRLDSARRLLA